METYDGTSGEGGPVTTDWEVLLESQWPSRQEPEYVQHHARLRSIQREANLSLDPISPARLKFGELHQDFMQLPGVARAIVAFCATHPLLDRTTLSWALYRNRHEVSQWLHRLKKSGWLKEAHGRPPLPPQSYLYVRDVQALAREA